MAFRDEAAHRHRPPGSGAPLGWNGRQRRDLTPDTAGSEKRAERAHREVSWQIALPPGPRRTLAPGSATAKVETAKARVRAQVEHPFRIVKRVFGCDRVRYRGLERNVQRFAPLLGFSNLMIAQPHLS